VSFNCCNRVATQKRVARNEIAAALMWRGVSIVAIVAIALMQWSVFVATIEGLKTYINQ